MSPVAAAPASACSAPAPVDVAPAVVAVDGVPVETPVEARAGFLDRPTLVVLIVSTSLMIAVVAVLYIGFFAR